MALGLISVKIPFNSCHSGIALTSLQLPEKCFVLGIVRDNQLILASAEPIIWCGDYVLAIALSQALVPALKVALNKNHPIHYSHKECFIKNSTIMYQELF
jgi:Trk K+ transport system NAD-binding subunit